MMTGQQNSSHRKTERGQNTVIVALSLGVLLLLVVGAVVLCAAIITTTSMQDFDQGNSIFGIFDTGHSGSSSLDVVPPGTNNLSDVLGQINFALEPQMIKLRYRANEYTELSSGKVDFVRSFSIGMPSNENLETARLS
jgi:hypothetical protein